MPLPEYTRLRLRLRPDLVISAQQSDGRRSWVVKDPIALRYFTFGPEEFSILDSLDGIRRLEDLRERFERSFAPQRMTMSRLAQFISNLYANGLLLSDDDSQGETLLERRAKELHADRARTATNLLSIRFRGIDAEPILRWLYPKVRWCFSPLAISAFVLLAIVAALLLLTHFAQFRAQLPGMSDFVTPRNLLWLSATLAVTKIVHELAHATCCRHFGGECHELGLMFLIFTPCLYCNVTDAWMLRDRKQRIAISAAGIVAEAVLASLAILGWWFTQPGLLHTIFINVVLVCGIGSVVFNGNPLLRYDGYFILSDWLDYPNLWQESRALLRRKILGWFSVRNSDAFDEQPDRAATLLTYAAASIAYQSVLLVTVALTLYRYLADVGMEILGFVFLLVSSIGMALARAPQLQRWAADPLRLQRTRWPRVAAAGTMGALLACAFCLVPLPCRVHAPAVIQPHGPRHVYVTTPGILIFNAKEGSHVQAGEKIAQLENVEIDRRVAELEGEFNRLQARVNHMTARATINASAAAELVIAREICADAKQRLDQQLREQQALTLIAPTDGTIVPPPPKAAISTEDSGRLPVWRGTPLDPQNDRCFLPRGTLLCLVADPTGFEAVAFVDETDIQFVHAQQNARLWFDVGHAEVVDGQVAEIADGNMQFVPDQMAAENELASRSDHTGKQRPQGTLYQVRLQLASNRSADLIFGSRGSAKIQVDWQTLAERSLRFVGRTLNARVWKSPPDVR